MKINVKDFTRIKNRVNTAYTDILKGNRNDPSPRTGLENLLSFIDNLRGVTV